MSNNARADKRIEPWWYGYLLLIAIAMLGVVLLTGSVPAGALAGGCVVLSAAWTASRYTRDRRS